ASVQVAPADPDGLIRVSGRDYRGGLTVLPLPQGLLAINRVSLEDYYREDTAALREFTGLPLSGWSI
ncbi:MAG: hypothetical protein ACO3ZZ_07565, partial [Solirubrobacterales bacterium]